MKKTKPFLWIPTLYLAEGIPYTAVMTLSLLLYAQKGLSIADIALYTGWFYLPWLIKPLWSPVVEMIRPAKAWISVCQIIMGAALASLGLTLPLDNWLSYSLIFFWITAFLSATNDIASDGYYIEALNEQQQSMWVGIRSTFYKIAMLLCQGALVIIVGLIQKSYDTNTAWATAFIALGILLTIFGVYHTVILSKTRPEATASSPSNILHQIKTFFQKDNILMILLFLMLYRLGEAQLSKISVLFLNDSIVNGGLALSTESIGAINGTFGLISMMLGGILGGIAISRKGLSYWMMPMIIALNAPDIFYVIMSATQTSNIWLIAAMVSVEQFGYGFGFAAYSVFMLKISKGNYPISHYSIATAFMAAGMMLPGMASGWLQSKMGYTTFFVWATICAIPSVIIAIYARKTKYLNDEQ